VGAFDPQLHRRAYELGAGVLLQRSGQKPGFCKHLEPVADSDDGTTGGGEFLDGAHDRREAGDGTRAQVVAVREAAGKHDGVEPRQRAIAVPDQFSFAAERADRLDHIELAVRTGEHNNTNPPAHVMLTSTSSMTGLARRRSHSWLTRVRALSTSGASITNR